MMKFLVVLLAALKFALSKPEETCLDPTDKEGVCVNFVTCRELRNLFGGEVENYLREQLFANSSCGPTKICCTAEKSFPSHILDLLKKLPERPYSCGEFQIDPQYKKFNYLGVCMSKNDCSRISTMLLMRFPNNYNIDCSSDDVCCNIDREYFPRNLKRCIYNREDFILGATPTKLYEHPWTALLYYIHIKGKVHKPKCAGSLINDRYVLTAAHCVVNTGDWNLTKVRVGEYDTETEKDCHEHIVYKKVCAKRQNHQDIEIEEIIVHEDYDIDSAHNDIALIRLSKSLNNIKYVKPVCLPLGQRNEDSSYFAVGWGLSETGQIRTVKGKVELPNVAFEDCQRIIETYGRAINETQICAGGADQKDTCNGDSGGSLMLNSRPDELFGITSFGISFKNDTKTKSCGRPGIPAVYTRVDRYLEWIANNIKEAVAGETDESDKFVAENEEN